jgi:hypothetical protein
VCQNRNPGSAGHLSDLNVGTTKLNSYKTESWVNNRGIQVEGLYLETVTPQNLTKGKREGSNVFITSFAPARFVYEGLVFSKS